jgi:hypothetical protein
MCGVQIPIRGGSSLLTHRQRELMLHYADLDTTPTPQLPSIAV